MSKVILLLFTVFLMVSFVVAQGASTAAPMCKPGGRICSSDTECCVGLICNPWAGRCTKPKTTTAAPAPSKSGNFV
ncbi:uncharacterized protein LOC106637569 [Copidosoma floridanum]|uniref:uncharacterized protein LOC106637569 n=1 Tax=Copidosoma floridanum TaxID=29053 RepID=UPI0006C97FB9|nr:uncharacterized protein LOC106637569 [Copidosoma floridanum]